MITKFYAIAGAAILAVALQCGSGSSDPPSGDVGRAPAPGPGVCHLPVTQDPTMIRTPGKDGGKDTITVTAVVHMSCQAPYPRQNVLNVWLLREVGNVSGKVTEGWKPMGDNVKRTTIPDEEGFPVTVTAAATYTRTTVRWRVGASVKGFDSTGAWFEVHMSESEGHPTALHAT